MRAEEELPVRLARKEERRKFMKDNDSIEALELPTIIRNALLGKGIRTIGNLKNHIREHGRSGIRHIGRTGWYRVAEKLLPCTEETDTELISVLRGILKEGKYCHILKKSCPTDANCSQCELSEVYGRFGAM